MRNNNCHIYMLQHPNGGDPGDVGTTWYPESEDDFPIDHSWSNMVPSMFIVGPRETRMRIICDAARKWKFELLMALVNLSYRVRGSSHQNDRYLAGTCQESICNGGVGQAEHTLCVIRQNFSRRLSACSETGGTELFRELAFRTLFLILLPGSSGNTTSKAFMTVKLESWIWSMWTVQRLC